MPRMMLSCIPVVMLLTGCTASLATVDAKIEDVVQEAAAVVDNLNSKAMWQLCEGTTMGGYQRMPAELRAKVDAMCMERGGAWLPPSGGTQ